MNGNPPWLADAAEALGECRPEDGAPLALIAIGETIGQQCSICRSRHGSEVRHACE